MPPLKSLLGTEQASNVLGESSHAASAHALTNAFTANGTDASETLDDLTRGPNGTVSDLGGNDVINGAGGNDTIYAYNGNDTVNGGEGNDYIYDWGSGNDTFRGEGGNDTIFVKSGDNIVDGGTGSDTVSYTYGSKPVWIDLAGGSANSLNGHDTLTSIENAVGSSYDDAIVGNSGANMLNGDAGDDWVDGGAGDDKLFGSYGNDTLKGGAGNDYLDGGSGIQGNDRLDGGTGNDTLVGGFGIDTMTGGTGADRFVFESKADFGGSGWDTITDFQHGVDKIDLSRIDARPDIAGNQAFTFDATRDGSWEEFKDGLSDDWQGLIGTKGGPTINGEMGEIETRYENGYTYVFLGQGDGLEEASFRLQGNVNLTASDFVL